MINYNQRRNNLIEELKNLGVKDNRVLSAMCCVPRHLFVEEALRARSYNNVALPIGLGQTISQPFIVAKMSELLIGNDNVQNLHKVLEIGTGCGYQTAILEQIGIPNIYSIERISFLREKAKINLRNCGFIKSRLKCSDGYLGLPSEAPFNAIIITAASKDMPINLLDQLSIGGRMVLPLERLNKQYLFLIDKLRNGFKETCVMEVRFVPLLSGCVL